MTPVIDPLPSVRSDSPSPAASRGPDRSISLHGLSGEGKRLFDLLASALLLAMLSPLCVLIGLWVAVDSPGLIIFRQTRVGRNGCPFTLYKFRTMRSHAPILPTDEMAKQTVSYYTRSGALLRRFSLDELPQLWNVLIGEMSLIGPRPALPTQDWLNAMRAAQSVHDLRPGITGWAQVCGRDDLPDAEKLEHDVYYRQHLSPLLDTWIIWRTVAAVTTGRGAK